MGCKINWRDKKLIENAVKESGCLAECLRYLGLSPFGSNSKTLKNYITLYNIDTSHFNASKARIRKPKLSVNDYLVKGRLANANLRRKIIKSGILPYKCSICGISDWMNKPISLHLDHIDGDRTNNTLENLRWLCPNCHSQTDTYAGRNIKK